MLYETGQDNEELFFIFSPLDLVRVLDNEEMENQIWKTDGCIWFGELKSIGMHVRSFLL